MSREGDTDTVAWTSGTGRTARGDAEDLVALLAGTGPAGRVAGWVAPRTASDTA